MCFQINTNVCLNEIKLWHINASPYAYVFRYDTRFREVASFTYKDELIQHGVY